MQPRALWIATHHADLRGKLPGNWDNLLDCVEQLLANSINDDSFAKVLASAQSWSDVQNRGGLYAVHMHPGPPVTMCSGIQATYACRCIASHSEINGVPYSVLRFPTMLTHLGRMQVRSAKQAVAAGALSSKDVYAPSAKVAAGANGAPDGDGGDDGPSAAIDEPDIAVEGLEAAVAALERLTQLLDFNCRDEVTQGLKVLTAPKAEHAPADVACGLLPTKQGCAVFCVLELDLSSIAVGDPAVHSQSLAKTT